MFDIYCSGGDGMQCYRLQYQSRNGIAEKLYPVGADMRCIADAVSALDHGSAVLIQPLSDAPSMIMIERPPR